MITVIIPMYNAEETIELVLDSVRTQTACNLIQKVIVVDDGSQDSSAEVIKGYMRKWTTFPLQYIYQENQGVAAARNRGYREAQTKYIAFLDADDAWLPRKIERQIEIINKNPQIRFLGTAWEDTPLRIGFRKITSLYNGTVKDVCIKNFPVTPSILMETSFRDEVGYFNEKCRYAEDINYFQKIAALGNYYFLPEKLVQIDINKNFFAQTGQSSHLKEMHKGTIRNITELRNAGQISLPFWICMRIFYQLKYYRRVFNRTRSVWKG